MGPDFKGAAHRLTDYDLPRIGAIIGVGEDILHAVMDVEAPKSGFDEQGRPRILFEPHIFYRELGPGAKRDEAVRQGLAYQNWKPGAYGPESAQYGKLARAILIDRGAALRSCSWGRGQIMGFNCALAGYASAEAMAAAFADSEAAQVEGIVRFAASKRLDTTLRAIDKKARSTPNDWRQFAGVYNGAGYEKALNGKGYHVALSERFNWWRTVPDTPWAPQPAAANTADAVPVEHLPTAPVAPTHPPAPVVPRLPPDVEPVAPAPQPQQSRVARFLASFFARLKG